MIKATSQTNFMNVNNYSKQIQNTIPFKGNSQAGADTVELHNNEETSTKTKVAIATGILGAVALAFGAICYHKGKGANGVEKKFLQQLKDGWNVIFKQTEKEISTKLDTRNISEFINSGTTVEQPVGKGNTVQETIKNILGENSNITPHNYDLSKEFDSIPVYRNHGGYKEGIATTSGIIQNNAKWNITPGIRATSISHSVEENGKGIVHHISNDFTLLSGTVGEYENKCVQLKIPQINADGYSNTSITLSFISQNQDFTPMQKDLLKLAEHPAKMDTSVFEILTRFKDGNKPDGEIDYENVGKYKNLDYNVILSAIQSMAKAI